MSTWLASLSQQEKDEMFLDLCSAFNTETIGEQEFRQSLARLGFNATDIEGYVNEHRPSGDDNDPEGE